MGFSLADVDFGLAVMKPTSVLDSAVYYSLKATANDVEFGGNDLVDLTVSQICVEVNEGVDPLSLGFPTGVDFRSSFETLAGADDGALQIATGGDPISLDVSEPVARVTSQGATLSLSDYVHAVGNFSFAYSAHSNVTLGTGMPANLGDISSALLDSLN